MYDRMVDVPRLLQFYGEGEPLPDPLLVEARDALSATTPPSSASRSSPPGCASTATAATASPGTATRIGRGRTEDTMVAILSLGSPRALLLRPRGGGPTLRHQLGHGDLVVMGGSCQRTWEHAIPKTARPVGPRISIQFRPRGVR